MINEILSGRPIQLIDVIYNRARKQNNGKYGGDSVEVIYKDENGNHCVAVEKEPKIKVYRTVQGYVPPFPLDYIPKNLVDVYEVPFNGRELEIANLLGEQYVKQFFDNIRDKRFYANMAFHQSKYIYRSDMSMEEYMRIEYNLHCNPIENLSNFHVSKSFLDIEVDVRDYRGTVDDLSAEADRPTNVVTLYLKDEKKAFTLVLRDSTNPGVQELEDNQEQFLRDLKEEILDEVRGQDQLESFVDEFDIDYNMFWYDNEINLIMDVFQILHTYKPDFGVIWNMRFDIGYLLSRIKNMGYDPKEIICHPDFMDKKCFLSLDTKAEEIHERTDNFIASMYTKFLDQMIIYGGLRKGGPKIESLRLTDIGYKEAGFEKEDYSHVADSLGELIKKNFTLFIKYNIRDVLVQLAIELLVEDIDNIYTRSLKTATPYHMMFKPSVFLKNRYTVEYDKQGLIICNNRNKDYIGAGNDGPKEKFEGAVVGDPDNNMYNGIDIYGTGKRSRRVFDNVIDFDLTSLYPSIIDSCNICSASQYFRIYIDEVVNENENYYGETRYDRGGNFIDDLECQSWLRFMNKWFGLPSIDEMIKDLGEIYGDDTMNVSTEVVKLESTVVYKVS